MYLVYPGPDGTTVTIKDPKSGKTQTIPVKAGTAKAATLPNSVQTAAFMVRAFRSYRNALARAADAALGSQLLER